MDASCVPGEGRTAADVTETLFPFRRRLRENWAQAWFKGPVEFEIEWVPKARYFTFSLTFNFDKEERLG